MHSRYLCTTKVSVFYQLFHHQLNNVVEFVIPPIQLYGKGILFTKILFKCYYVQMKANFHVLVYWHMVADHAEVD